MLADVWGHDRSSIAAYSPDGRQLIVDRVARWDVEWRCYRGGQNPPRQILDLTSPHLAPRSEVAEGSRSAAASGYTAAHEARGVTKVEREGSRPPHASGEGDGAFAYARLLACRTTSSRATSSRKCSGNAPICSGHGASRSSNSRCRVEPQEDNRVRFWAAIPELDGRYLRVVTLEDRETIHNAFPDRGFEP